MYEAISLHSRFMETCDEVWLLGEKWQSGLRTDPKIIRPKVYSSSEKTVNISIELTFWNNIWRCWNELRIANTIMTLWSIPSTWYTLHQTENFKGKTKDGEKDIWSIFFTLMLKLLLLYSASNHWAIVQNNCNLKPTVGIKL